MTLATTGAPAAESPTAGTETEIEATAAAAAEVSTDANAAESSAADEKDAKPTDLLSVVKDAVQKDEVEAGSSAAEGEGEAKPKGEAEAKPAEGEAEATQAEADAKLPFHEHPRWKEVLAERDGYKEDAGRFREVESFMQTHGLTAQEVGEGFDIMAKLKSGNPEDLTAARDYFASAAAHLDGVLGNVLPDDLRERVESGLVDEETAQELARERAAGKLRTAQTERDETASTEARQRSEGLANAQRCAEAVDTWEAKQKAADPDYAKKAALVETTCRAIVQRTGQPPRTPGEAVALAEAGLSEVNKQFKSLVPPPKPIRPSPSTGSSARPTAEPKTLREAIEARLAG